VGESVQYSEAHDLEAHSLKEEEEKEEEHVLITFFGLVCWYSARQHEEGKKYPNYCKLFPV